MVIIIFSFFILFHLPCFTVIPPNHRRRRRRRRNSAASPKTSFFSFFKRLFSPSSSKLTPHPSPSLPSHSSSKRSLLLNPTLKPPPIPDADIYPCTVCGEILPSPPLLDHHRSLHHPLSDLADGENIVRIIFKTGWPGSAKPPNIHRILKIHSSPKIISRFEEYREHVKSMAAAKPRSAAAWDIERCIADGNELLRFHCTTYVCELDGGGVCRRQYCSLCGIIANGFSPKMDGISTLPTSYAAHVSMPEDMEEEFRFMSVKRAVLVCRVVAGRVGCDPCEVDKEDPGFDSLAGRGEGDEEDELLVFNPRAVLPCFVIVYTV